ncbi:hypothetical protein OF83DRAFT_472513 [Amylostereum chailletii]|nr:hypothetical protein OF83DRAFT_472513 [Amylostereum chailletii]
MNFWDSTLASSTTGAATPPPDAGRQQSLNEEVTEVMGQLNRFWGGFRRQSQDAIQAARKDLGDVVAQAQKEFSKLSIADSVESSSRDPSVSIEGERPASPSASSSTTLPEQPISPSQSTNLFSRLQTALPPDLLSTLQSNLPDSIRHAPERLDLTQLRSTLQQVRLQEATVRGEELLRSAGVFLRDAVKVIPPGEEAVAREGAEASFQATPGLAKGKGREGSSVSTSDLKTIGTRKAALLQALRTNPAILKVDPASEQNSEALYKTWEEKEVQGSDGGILGATWKTRINDELTEAGEGLTASRDSLVPSEIAEDVFWTRYFFRVYQIEQEEERRKALLAGSSAQEEDFSWEDEDDETTSPTSTLPGRPDVSPAGTAKDLIPAIKAGKSASQAASPNTTSPPQSEASYDLVSATASTAGETRPTKKPEAKKDAEEEGGDDSDDDEGDEDDEEEEEDDDDDDEEDSGESDWE